MSSPFILQPPIVYVDNAQAWEYRRLTRNLAKEEAPSADDLDALGVDGWELAAILTDSPFVYFYFKRLKG